MHQDFMKTRVENVREGFFLTTTVHVTSMRQIDDGAGWGRPGCLPPGLAVLLSFSGSACCMFSIELKNSCPEK